MPIFDYEFVVDAPRSAVAAFHYNASVKTLTPLPIIAQLHYHEPVADGSKSNFTLWFGPFPVHWKVVHSDVDESGFADTQIRGPLKRWRHNHRFFAQGDGTTRVSEHIEYEYRPGLAGLLSRLIFSGPALTMLFIMRKMITRRLVRDYLPAKEMAAAGEPVNG
jgi:ligand-binding SRPBCC domain-containing protein